MNAKAVRRRPGDDAARKAAREAAAAQAAAEAETAEREFWSFKKAGLFHVAVIVVALMTAVFTIRLVDANPLLVLIPVALGVLPLVLPKKLRVPAAIVNAVIVTVFTGVSNFAYGFAFTVLAFVMCAAAIVPWRMKKGLEFANMPLWRSGVGMLIALPALLTTVTFINESQKMGIPVIAFVVVSIALAVALGLGKRVASLGVVAAGLVLMLIAIVAGGLLTFAFWLIGGLFVVLGTITYAAWGEKTKN